MDTLFFLDYLHSMRDKGDKQTKKVRERRGERERERERERGGTWRDREGASKKTCTYFASKVQNI